MKVTERDGVMALTIAKLLGVELEPWQEFMLQHMLAGHREPDPPKIAVAPGPCDNTFSYGPGVDVLRCRLRAGHAGQHESADGATWGTEVRATQGPPWCGVGHPSGENIFCDLKSGHVGMHEAGQPGTVGYRRWLTKGACGNTYSRGPVPPVLHCARAAGHEGRHSYGGMFWGSSDSS